MISQAKADELRSKPVSISQSIENTRGLSQGVTLEAEMLTSIAISLKRIADTFEDLARDQILNKQ